MPPLGLLDAGQCFAGQAVGFGFLHLARLGLLQQQHSFALVVFGAPPVILGLAAEPNRDRLDLGEGLETVLQVLF